ncbi:M20/M25/M40 family metallo-hydrolase [Achromobacter aloeverae]
MRRPRQPVAARGYSNMRMPSGAGHDAVFVARHFPVAMVFIPCKDGVSHNEAESILPEHAEYGANVMLDVILAAAMT